jgi:hypothetical protein
VRWQSSRFFAEAGRTHTGIGYWNNAYHHGRWLQPTIARPRWVAFEDDNGILPVHWIGFGVGARLPVGTATLNLMATVGNGRGYIVDDVRRATTETMKAFHASVSWSALGGPSCASAWRGSIASAVRRSTTVPATDRGSIGETIGSAHIAVNVPLLFISEGYVIHTMDGQRWTTFGGFALVGHLRRVPLCRVERIASRGDPTPSTTPDSASFDTIQDRGLRFDLSDWTAVKAEYRQITPTTAGPPLPGVAQLVLGLLSWLLIRPLQAHFVAQRVALEARAGRPSASKITMRPSCIDRASSMTWMPSRSRRLRVSTGCGRRVARIGKWRMTSTRQHLRRVVAGSSTTRTRPRVRRWIIVATQPASVRGQVACTA